MQGSFVSERLGKGFRNQIVYGLYSLTDPLFHFLLALGLVGWFVGTPEDKLSWDWLIIKAVAEELFFRFLLQESMERLFGRRRLLGPITLANLLASLAFAAMHLFRQPPLWAAMTILPSLVFGYAWDRYRSVFSTSVIHFTYNALLFHRIF